MPNGYTRTLLVSLFFNESQSIRRGAINARSLSMSTMCYTAGRNEILSLWYHSL